MNDNTCIRSEFESYTQMTQAELFSRYKAAPISPEEHCMSTCDRQGVLCLGTDDAVGKVFIKINFVDDDPSNDLTIIKRLVNEVRAMRKCLCNGQDASIIQLVDVVRLCEYNSTISSSQRLAIVSKMAPGTTLYFLPSNGRKVILSQLLPLAKTLEQLHSFGLWHGDLKAENVIYDKQSNKCMLVDLGGALDVGLDPSAQPKIRPVYMDQSYLFFRRPYDESSEVYGLGSLIAETLLIRDLLDPEEYGHAFSIARYLNKKNAPPLLPYRRSLSEKLMATYEDNIAALKQVLGDQLSDAEQLAFAVLCQMIDPIRIMRRPTLRSVIEALETNDATKLVSRRHRACKRKYVV